MPDSGARIGPSTLRRSRRPTRTSFQPGTIANPAGKNGPGPHGPSPSRFARKEFLRELFDEVLTEDRDAIKAFIRASLVHPQRGLYALELAARLRRELGTLQAINVKPTTIIIRTNVNPLALLGPDYPEPPIPLEGGVHETRRLNGNAPTAPGVLHPSASRTIFRL